MTSERALAMATLLSVVVVALFLLSGISAAVSSPASPSARASAPSGSTALPWGAPSPAPSATSAPHRNLAAAPSAAPSCPTPEGAPDWTSANFFDDALVDFQVPGYSNLSGSNFQTVPCQNDLPTYLQSFWMNISTNVQLSDAYLTIWGTGYPTPTDPLPPLGGYNPATPVTVPMYIPTAAPNTASFYFNLYEFFYPGSTVYFNVTLETSQAAPSTITSTESPFRAELPSGYTDNASWAFYVAAPWWSTTFTNDIQILTSPSVLGVVPYPPNPVQQFSVDLQSVTASGAAGPAIPEARFNFALHGQFTGSFSLPFGPLNTSRENLSGYAGSAGIGPYPGTEVSFYITAWLPWEGGAIDLITSPTYNFTWSSGGGWAHPTLGLDANAVVRATPNVFASGGTTLPTGTPVNLSVQVPAPNETISSAVLRFTYADAAGTVSGNLPMTLTSENTSYVRIPGLPTGGTVSYSLTVKDVNGDPVSSGTYAYSETGTPSRVATSGSAWIYVEGVNLSDGALLPGLTYTIANGSWAYRGPTNPLGFGAPLAASQDGYRLLGDGIYTVAMTAYGHTVSTQVTVAGSVPIVVRFPFSPPGGPVGGQATVPVVAIVAALVVGPLVVTAALVPLYLWYRERQARALAEQKRITL